MSAPGGAAVGGVLDGDAAAFEGLVVEGGDGGVGGVLGGEGYVAESGAMKRGQMLAR